MILKSIQGRLTLLFAAFALLVLVSVSATVWGLETQMQDALVINLAGRQRMLTQQMARLAFEAGAGENTANAALQETEQAFDQTLRALMDGGTAPYLSDTTVTLPLTRDPGIRSALNDVTLTWSGFRAPLDKLQQTPHDDPSFSVTLQSIEEKSSTLAAQADQVVRLYEADSVSKVNRLRFIQIGFFVCALILLGAGVWLTRHSALQPLRQLARAANRLGENDLETAIQPEGPEEMRKLAQAFESMRVRLRSSRQELVELNESLEERVAQRTRELETLNEVSREISSRLELQQVLNSVTEKARALLGGEVASLCLVDENQHWMKLQAVSGPPNAVSGQAVRADEDLAQAVMAGDQALICGVGACRGGCRMLSEPYRVSHLAAPLRIGERVIGALCIGSAAQDRFAGESAGMLTKLANAAAIALENARLYAQAERVATLEERHRVAAEMHDGLGQTLSYLGLMTDQVVDFLSDGKDEDALQRLHKTRETIGKATSEVRRAINSLMDETPAERDLCVRLRELVDEFASEHGLKAAWQPDEESAPDCSPQIAEQVLNIMREALNNIVRHAAARQVTVRMGKTDGDNFVSIQDDGRGFDSSQASPQGHFGLQIMQARAAHIGGRVEIESASGQGTCITLTWTEAEGNQ
jgi:two-component system nitrate/nitrite sensor histidine kinase NarX